ncbi:helix-turn-helix domain-containing protein [Sphingorhabdus arenilitoris]|uniref:Helix-turn-helix domain-containing protein n=1 Tax=Sphingorhabdus arenilitoris TaxID=1490041 RepID=A0ABV8RGT4_9SPHN
MRNLIAKNVKAARVSRGVTQAAFAELCGFSQQYLSDLENGKRNPTVITLYEISRALKVEVHLLIMQHEDESWLLS